MRTKPTHAQWEKDTRAIEHFLDSREFVGPKAPTGIRFQSVLNRQRGKPLPERMLKNRKLLLRWLDKIFPTARLRDGVTNHKRSRSDPHKRHQAVLWLRVIHLYYYVGLPSPGVASEINNSHTLPGAYQDASGKLIVQLTEPEITARQVRKILEHVQNLLGGKRQNGGAHTSGRPGRPRKEKLVGC
jgi:hypothetical protein